MWRNMQRCVSYICCYSWLLYLLVYSCVNITIIECTLGEYFKGDTMRILQLATIAAATLVACTAIESAPLSSGKPANGITYYLPKTLIPIQVARDGQYVSVVIDNPITVADTDFALVAEYQHSWLSDDDFKVTTADGLLLGVTSITTDRSLDALKSVAELVKELVKLSAVPVEGAAVVFDGQVDPRPGGIGQSELADALAAYGGSVSFSKLTRSPTTEPQLTVDDLARCSVGICYRAMEEYIVTFHIQTSEGPQTIQKRIQSATGSLVAVTLDRSAFVKREITIALIGGVPTELADKKPSEIIELLGAPIEIVKSFASIPSDILTLRTQQVNDQAAITNAEAAKINAQTGLIEALAKLRKATEEGGDDN